MVKKLLALMVGLAVILGASSCNVGQPKGQTADDGKIKVVVTFDVLQHLVKAVGGDKVAVSVIVPDGTEVHDFEPKAKDLAALSEADVFVYNGLGLESWVDEALASSDNSGLIVVNASEGAEPIVLTNAAEISEHGQYDPHLWLSLKGAQVEVRNIQNALIKASPENKALFEQNGADFTAQLEGLYAEYATKFQTVSTKDFVTGHAAFGYLCRDFGLTQNSVEDVFAEGEPTAQKLAALITYCREHNVKTIFAEQMASPAVSQTLANEVGAQVKTIYTLESSEDGQSYLQRMTANLASIYDSLK
ncbi:metal ABC transporter substrate-binding protein [Oscillospiraceae bacterium WX1]